MRVRGGTARRPGAPRAVDRSLIRPILAPVATITVTEVNVFSPPISKLYAFEIVMHASGLLVDSVPIMPLPLVLTSPTGRSVRARAQTNGHGRFYWYSPGGDFVERGVWAITAHDAHGHVVAATFEIS